MTVYWLGRDFAPGGGLPELALRNSGGCPRTMSKYQATLAYRQASDRFGPPIIGMQEWRLDDWYGTDPESPGNIWKSPGVTSEEIALPDGRAVIFRIPSMRAGTPDRFLALLYLVDTVIRVDDFDSPSAFSSGEGMRAIARGLRPYR